MLAIKEMGIKTTMTYYSKPVRTAKIKDSEDTKYWQGC